MRGRCRREPATTTRRQTCAAVYLDSNRGGRSGRHHLWARLHSSLLGAECWPLWQQYTSSTAVGDLEYGPVPGWAFALGRWQRWSAATDSMQDVLASRRLRHARCLPTSPLRWAIRNSCRQQQRPRRHRRHRCALDVSMQDGCVANTRPSHSIGPPPVVRGHASGATERVARLIGAHTFTNATLGSQSSGRHPRDERSNVYAELIEMRVLHHVSYERAVSTDDAEPARCSTRTRRLPVRRRRRRVR